MSSLFSATLPYLTLDSRYAGDVAFAVVCVVLIVVVVGGLHTHARSDAVSDGAAERCMRSVREVSRLIVACEQDADPLQRLLHAQEALARTAQLRVLVTDSEADRVVGVKLHEVYRDAEAALTQALEALYTSHPALKPASKYGMLSTSTAEKGRRRRARG